MATTAPSGSNPNKTTYIILGVAGVLALAVGAYFVFGKKDTYVPPPPPAKQGFDFNTALDIANKGLDVYSNIREEKKAKGK